MSKDFNNVKKWLTGKLTERGLNTTSFVLATGNAITGPTIFRWYNDTFRPTPEKMAIVCDWLSKLPIIEEGRQPRQEYVPLWEGMAQFSEKPDRTKRR